jgi:RNA polymerase sigma-70 factor (ECF subfamily)
MPLEATTIAQILTQQRDRLFAQAWAIVRDAQLVEDTLQELSILAIQKGGSLEDEKHLTAWLRRSVRFKALEVLRMHGRAPLAINDAILDQIESYWAERDRHNDTRRVDALAECLDRLTPKNRRLLQLRYVDGKKSAEIAAVVGHKADVIYTMIARVHRSLRECVEAKLQEESAR